MMSGSSEFLTRSSTLNRTGYGLSPSVCPRAGRAGGGVYPGRGRIMRRILRRYAASIIAGTVIVLALAFVLIQTDFNPPRYMAWMFTERLTGGRYRTARRRQWKAPMRSQPSQVSSGRWSGMVATSLWWIGSALFSVAPPSIPLHSERLPELDAANQLRQQLRFLPNPPSVIIRAAPGQLGRRYGPAGVAGSKNGV